MNPRMKQRPRHSIPVLIAVLTLGLMLGSVGTATAVGLTSAQVRKIVAKVVTKKASGLSVAHADTAHMAETAHSADDAQTLNGLPGPTYLGGVAHAEVSVGLNVPADTIATALTVSVSVPSGGGVLHSTAVGTIDTYNPNTAVAMWAALDASCATLSGPGYQFRAIFSSSGTTGQGVVDITYPAAAGAHTVNLCVQTTPQLAISQRTLTVELVG